MPTPGEYEIKPIEAGWTGWQTALVPVVGGLLEWQGVPVLLAMGIGGFAAASSRPVLGYVFAFLPRPKVKP